MRRIEGHGNMLLFSELLLNIFMRILRYGRIPQHIAFIPDNNRTFAKKTKIDLLPTYLKGQTTLFKLLEWCVFLKTSNVSIYLLSTHNLKRSEHEKQCVFDAVYVFLHKLLIQPMNCKIKVIGDVTALSHELQELCTELSNQTSDNNGILVNVALNYSGKEELINASHKMLQHVNRSKLKSYEINNSLFNNFVHTKSSPDVDLVIRTSTDKRLSEFLLWQNTRSVLNFIDICWPEITGWHFLKAVFLHQNRTK